MCIVIDINTLGMVFDEKNDRHKEFVAVKEWIFGGLGVVVFGGTKYKRELALAGRYMRVLRLLQDSGRAASVSDEAVDEQEKFVKKATDGSDCDDQHIIALLGAARCPLLCSVDSRSYEYVKDRSLYPKNAPAVKIYTSARNKRLLKKSNVESLKNIEKV